MQSGQPVKLLPCGDTALAVELGEGIDRDVSALVLGLAGRLAAERIAGVVELVPTFRSLLIHYDPVLLSQAELRRTLAPLLSGLQPARGSGRLWRIPACYDESFAPDLPEVAGRTGISPQQVAVRHSAAAYHVYMLGFLPGFAYLGDLPPELALPRRESPRTKVPAGSIAMATTLTTVYTLESPGGWHLIGRTPAFLWDLRHDPPALLAPGDSIVFTPVSPSEYEALAARAEAGTYRLEPEQQQPRGAHG